MLFRMARSLIICVSISTLGRTLEEFENSSIICSKCECQNEYDVFVMNCANRQVHHTLSNWPQDHVDKILKVSFSYNIITSLKPFPHTESKVEILLDHCGIVHLESGVFEQMRNTRLIDLSYNNLTSEELSSDVFKGPYDTTDFEPLAVTYLNLAYNNIHSLPQRLFEHMPNLEYFNVEGNDFEVLDMHTQLALSSVPKVQYLNLANNELTELIETAINKYENLREIDLRHNLLDFVPHSLRFVSKTLQKLSFDGNPLFEMNDATFLVVPNIVELSLNDLTELKVIHANTFTPLTYLKRLSLARNALLEIIEHDAFGGNQSLVELYMDSNNLEEIHPDLMNWSSLKIFKFGRNPLRCSCNLYNISAQLAPTITRTKDGPTCYGFDRSYQVFSLDEETCEQQVPKSEYHGQHQFTVLRISLITMSVVMIAAMLVAIGVVYTKRRKYGVDVFPFVTPVRYKNIITSES